MWSSLLFFLPMSQLAHKLLAKLWHVPHRPTTEKRRQLDLLRNSENLQKKMQEDGSEGIEGISRQISEAEVQV